MTALKGCLVPDPPWEGRLVAVHGKALSILHPDGALVSVVRRPGQLEARALLPAGGWDRFPDTLDRLLAAGSVSVSWDGQVLAFNGEGKPHLVVPFIGSGIWDPRPELAACAARLTAAGMRGLADRLELALAASPAVGRFGSRSAVGKGGEGAFATAFRRLAGAADFPVNLVGFGPGTTPAGDDWLSGYLLAADLLAGGPGAGAAELRLSVRAALPRTGAAGRALLEGSLAGVPPAYLVALALALADPGPDAEAALARAVGEALEHGASSGEDALAGLLAGLRGEAG